MKVGALFAGYGGIELALEMLLGTHVAWVSEFDKGPSKILAHRFPDAPNLGDITKIDWTQVEPVDIITGGSPCQDLSHAGKRLGMKKGTRSGLWASMLEAIKTIQPKLVIWENVSGAFSAEATSAMESCPGCVGDGSERPVLRALGRVLGDLTEAGYDTEWRSLRAADVGAPHPRLRVFVLAWPRESGKPRLGGRSLVSDAESHRREAHGLTRRPSPQVARLENDFSLLPTPAVNDMGAGKDVDAWDAWDAWTDRMKASHGNGNGHGKSLHIEALRMLPTPTANIAANGGSQNPDKRRAGGHQPSLQDVAEHVLLPTPRATDGSKGGPNQRGSKGDLMLPSAVHHLLPTPMTRNNENRQSEGYGPNLGTALSRFPTPKAGDADFGLPRTSGRPPEKSTHLATRLYYTDFGDYAPAIDVWERVIGRTVPEPTLPTGKSGNYQLSAAFVEWMMGLPDAWVTGTDTTRNEQLKALGNGVVPQQAAAAIQAILAPHDGAFLMSGESHE